MARWYRDILYTNIFYTWQSLYVTKFIQDKVYTGQSLYGDKVYTGQSLYGDKVYTGQSLYGDKVYKTFFILSIFPYSNKKCSYCIRWFIFIKGTIFTDWYDYYKKKKLRCLRFFNYNFFTRITYLGTWFTLYICILHSPLGKWNYHRDWRLKLSSKFFTSCKHTLNAHDKMY